MDFGGFGKGEECWWALWVGDRRETKAMQDLQDAPRQLPPLEDPETGELKPRIIETWLPKKTIRGWSTRQTLAICLFF